MQFVNVNCYMRFLSPPPNKGTKAFSHCVQLTVVQLSMELGGDWEGGVHMVYNVT